MNFQMFTKIAIHVLTMLLIVSCCMGNIATDEISEEHFIPQGLSGNCNYFCFYSDSTGFAASRLTSETAEDNTLVVLSRTFDRGRTWKEFGKINGNRVSIKISGNKLFLLTKEFIKTGEQKSMSKILSTGLTVFSPQLLALESDSEIRAFNVFNDSTYTYICEEENGMGILKKTDDYGKNWVKENLPGIVQCYPCATASQDKLFITMAKYEGTRHGIYIKNILNSNEIFIDTNARNIHAADSLIAVSPGMRFWKYDGQKFTGVSRYRWNFTGQYNPSFFSYSNGIFICAASDFYGKKGKHKCLFFSSNGGRNWQTLVLNDDIMLNNFFLSENIMTSIPEKYGASVLYQCHSNNELHIINIRKKK